MNLKEILKKIAEGTELSTDEKSFLQNYDPDTAEGRIPTPRGNIAVRLERSGQGIEAELRIPEGCSAVLPDGSKLETGTHLVQLEDAE